GSGDGELAATVPRALCGALRRAGRAVAGAAAHGGPDAHPGIHSGSRRVGRPGAAARPSAVERRRGFAAACPRRATTRASGWTSGVAPAHARFSRVLPRGAAWYRRSPAGQLPGALLGFRAALECHTRSPATRDGQ